MRSRLPKIIDSCTNYRVALVGMFFWRRDSTVRRCLDHFPVLFAVIAALARARAGPPPRAPPPPTSSPPSDPHNPQTDSGWQAGTCKKEPALTDRKLTTSQRQEQPGRISSKKRPPTRTSASPSSSSAHTTKVVPLVGTLEEPVSELKTSGSICRSASASTRARPNVPDRHLRSGRRELPGRLEGRRKRRHRLGAAGRPADRAGPRRHLGQRLQRRAEAGRGRPLRARTRRQRSLPRRRRRLGRRLPRGLHDRTCPHAVAGPNGIEGADPEKPPGLQRPRRRRHLPHHAEHLQRRSLHPVRQPLLDLPASGELRRDRSGGRALPAGAEPPLESPIPPGTSPKNCNTIPYAPGLAVDPGTTETNSPAPAARRRRRPAHHRRGRPGQLDDQRSDGDAAARDGDQPLRRGRAEQPEGLRKRPVRPPLGPADHLPGRVEDRHGQDRHRRRCRKATSSKAPSTSASRKAATRPRATSTGSSSTPPRPATGSTSGWSATSPPTR